jgi:hypothetical protein
MKSNLLADSVTTRNILYIVTKKHTMNVMEVRMRIAALRQYLRDFQHNMTPELIDEVLDVISKLMQVLAELEKRE